MQTFIATNCYAKQRGGALIVVLFLTGLMALALTSLLNNAGTSVKSLAHTKLEVENFYSVEESFNLALNWLRENSVNLVTASGFSGDAFYSNYDVNATYVVGANETLDFAPVSNLRMNGTQNVPLLSNDASVGVATYPNSIIFNPQTSFASVDFGGNLVKITLSSAIANTPAKDFGDTDAGNPKPQTDFYPVYKIDALSSVNQGTYVSGYAVGSLQTNTNFGFYGEDYVEMNQGCDSFESTAGAYGSGNQKANCDVGSHGPIRINQNETVYGDLTTTDSVTTTSPWGGDLCANFTSGCPDAGATCEGSACTVPALPLYNPWTTYCPTNAGNLNINSNTTLNIASDTPNNKCWNSVTLRNNRTLILTSTSVTYFIDTLDIPNTASLQIQPASSGGTVQLYVRNISGDGFNGNQIYNLGNQPSQFKIHYLGTDALTLNGTVNMGAFIVSPYAGVTVSGNFDYFGGIQAKNLTFSGSGSLHYDESGKSTVISDIIFTLKNKVQVTR